MREQPGASIEEGLVTFLASKLGVRVGARVGAKDNRCGSGWRRRGSGLVGGNSSRSWVEAREDGDEGGLLVGSRKGVTTTRESTEHNRLKNVGRFNRTDG